MDSIPLTYPDKNWLPWNEQRIGDSNMMPSNPIEEAPLEKREERFGDSLQQLNKIVERISPDSSGSNYRMGSYQNASKFVEAKNKFRGSYSSSFTDNLSDSAYETFAGDSSFECPPENNYLNSSDHLNQPNPYLDVQNNQNWQMDGWQNVKNNLPKSASLHNLYMKPASNMEGGSGGDMQNVVMNNSGEMSHCYSYDDIQERYYDPYQADAKKEKFSDVNNLPNKKVEMESGKTDLSGSKSFLEIGKCSKTPSVEGMSNDEGDKKADDDGDGKLSSYNTSYEEDDSKNDGDSNGKTGFMCSHCSFETFKKGQLRKHMSMHGVFLCAHCEFSSEVAEVLEDHRKISHPGLCGRKLCKKCRVLYQGEELEEHERVCSGEKQNWTCPVCQKEFKFLSVMKAHARKWHPNESIVIPSKTISASLAGHIDSIQQTSAADSTTGEMTPENEINITNNSDDFRSHNYMNNTKNNPLANNDNLPKDPNNPNPNNNGGNGGGGTQMYMHRSKLEKLNYSEQEAHGQKRVYNKGMDTLANTDVPPLELAFYCDCEGCYTTFRSDKELNVHRSTIHGLPPKRYHCRQPECSMQFAKFGHYKRHQLSHGGGGEKKYKCDWPNCGKAFCHTDNLKVHYRRHTDEKPYKCDKCASSYRQKSGLKYHLEKVHDEKSSGKPGRKRKNATLDVPLMENDNWPVDMDLNKDSRMLNKPLYPPFEPPKFNPPMDFYQPRPGDGLHKGDMGGDWGMRRVEHLHPFDKINPYKKLDDGSPFVNPIFHPITKHDNALNYYPNKHMMYPNPTPLTMSPASYMPHDRKKFEEEADASNILINMDNKMEVNKPLPPMDDKGWADYPPMPMSHLNMYPGYHVKNMKEEHYSNHSSYNHDNSEESAYNHDNNNNEDSNTDRNDSYNNNDNSNHYNNDNSNNDNSIENNNNSNSNNNDDNNDNNNNDDDDVDNNDSDVEEQSERNAASPYGDNKQAREEGKSDNFYDGEGNPPVEKMDDDDGKAGKEERNEDDGCESDGSNKEEEEEEEEDNADERRKEADEVEGDRQFIKTEVNMPGDKSMMYDDNEQYNHNDNEQDTEQGIKEDDKYHMKEEARTWTGHDESSSLNAKGWPRVLDSSMTESSHPPSENNFSLFTPMEKYLPGKGGLYGDLNKIKPQSERPDTLGNLNFFNMAPSYHPPPDYSLPISLASRTFYDNCYFTSPSNFTYSNMYRRPLNSFESLSTFQAPETAPYKDPDPLNRIGNAYNFFHPQSYEQRPYNTTSDSSMMAPPYDFSYSSSPLSPFSPPSFSLARPWTASSNSELEADAKRLYPLPYTQPTPMSRYF